MYVSTEDFSIEKGSKKEEEEEEEEGTSVKSVSERLHVEAQVREERLRERREHEEKKKELPHAMHREKSDFSYGAPMHERLKGISEKRERVMRGGKESRRGVSRSTYVQAEEDAEVRVKS